MSATLSLSAFEFMNGLKQSEEAAREFATKTSGHAEKADGALKAVGSGGGSGGAARAIQQLGFGIQDFASQLETRGLAGAIGAASNNLQMLGAVAGPTGLAVTAVGGAVAGIAIPAFLKWSGVIEDAKGKLDAAKNAAQAFADQLNGNAAFDRDTLNQTPEQFQKSQEELKKQIADKQKTIAELAKVGETFDKVAADQKKRQDNLWAMSGGGKLPTDPMASIFDMAKAANYYANPITMAKFAMKGGTFGQQGMGAQAQGWRQTLEKEMKELAGLQKRLDTDGEKFKQVQAVNAEREQRDRIRDMAKEHADGLMKGDDEVAKFRQQSLEKFGTEQQKLEAKMARERESLRSKTDGLADQASVLKQFDKQAEVERKRLQIAEAEKKIREMGKTEGGQIGALMGSVEGIRAINRAIAPRSEVDVAHQQLEVEKEQLKVLEEMARQGKDGINKGLKDVVAPDAGGRVGGNNAGANVPAVNNPANPANAPAANNPAGPVNKNAANAAIAANKKAALEARKQAKLAAAAARANAKINKAFVGPLPAQPRNWNNKPDQKRMEAMRRPQRDIDKSDARKAGAAARERRERDGAGNPKELEVLNKILDETKRKEPQVVVRIGG